MAQRFLQANLNHCARAQDLLVQSMAQWSIDVAAISEPYFIPSSDRWVGDLNGLVAIMAKSPLRVIARLPCCAAALVEGVLVVAVYFSPNRVLAEFESFLSDVGALIEQYHRYPALVLGDFNAKSAAWGSRVTDARGALVEEWLLEASLCLLNRGTVQTCVRQQGGSIVDLSLASPLLAHIIHNWRVLEEVETLSDHRYIRFELSPQSAPALTTARHSSLFPRWVLSKLDVELLKEAAIVQAWIASSNASTTTDADAAWFRRAMSQICDTAMPRSRPPPPRRQVYWWSQELSQLRIACITARRVYTRQRRRRTVNRVCETQLYEAYREAKTCLQVAIGRAKDAAREELLASVDGDPWGRPYRLVQGKLRPWTPPLTQTLEPQFLECVTATLFPSRAVHTPPLMRSSTQSADNSTLEVPVITSTEMKAVELRLKKKCKAPGPDGVPGRVLALALGALGPQLQTIFDTCLQQGVFPQQWKEGRLVLLRKEGRPLDTPSAYRPIVLLDEVGKLFERVIAARLVEHLSSVGPDLSDSQFGFRQGRSTIDAIQRVKTLSSQVVLERGVLLAVSLDIANAFNTLPWSVINEALRYHGAPWYLQRIIGAYLRERVVLYENRSGPVSRQMSCGVPQGSVLGPLLWNIGYDWVLRGSTLPGVSLVCYADDTLVLSRGSSFREAAHLATAGVAKVVGRIKKLGLDVALEKSEAIAFYGPRKAPPAGSHIVVSGVRIEVGSTMRYLGLVLDSRWTFDPHFERLAPRVLKTAAALSRLLPNLGGPGTSCRRLFMGVVRSMALYGAPIWAESVTRRGLSLISRPQRAMAVRVIRGYRTISCVAACLLAGTIPWDLDAKILASAYEWRKDLLDCGERPPPRAVEAMLGELRYAFLEVWAERLRSPGAGFITVEAIRPVLREWVGRRYGALTFRLTQVLSGHGCFGSYLFRIAQREPSPCCHHCSSSDDTAQHTLEVCPAWAAQRQSLMAVLGEDLSLPAVVALMVGSERSWGAVSKFCDDVMALKEVAEREREHTTDLPIRARRTRARRRADNALHQPP